MDPAAAIPPLSPADRDTLLRLTSPPPGHTSYPSCPSHPPTEDRATSDVDDLSRAHFLPRPDIRPHLEALQAYRAFRAEIEREHRVGQLVDLLIQLAHKAESPAEKRRAATAAIRLLFPPRVPRSSGADRPTASDRVPRSSGAASSPSSSSPARSAQAPAPHSNELRRFGAPEEDFENRCTPAPAPASPPSTLSTPSTPSTAASPTSPAPQPGPQPAECAAHLSALRAELFQATIRADAPAHPRSAPAGRLDRATAPRRSRAQSLALAAGAAPFDTT